MRASLLLALTGILALLTAPAAASDTLDGTYVLDLDASDDVSEM